MSEPRAPEFLLRDIPKNLDAGWWRWTGARPAVHCRLPEGGAWQAAFDYHVADATLKDTGPITLTFTVNGQQAGRQRCERAEEYHFRAPVPAGLARPGADLVLEAAVDHPWVSPSDGVKLGVLVTAAGFVRQ